MKRLILTKVIMSLLLVVSVLALNPIGINAFWKQNDSGIKYGLEYYDEVGWQLIDYDWYYFYTGYDKYSNESMLGYMAHDTWIDGYYVGSDGKWVDNPIFGFKDVNLRQIIKNKIGKTYGDFFKEEVKGITNLDIDNANISSLDGIENLVNLNRLHIGDNELYDISAVKGLTNLRVLYIESNKLTNMNAIIDTLKPLTNLKSLYLKYTRFTYSEKQALRDALPNCPYIIYHY